MPSHIDRVRADPTRAGLTSATLGNARALPSPDAVAAIPRAAAICGDLGHGLTDEAYSRPIRERAYLTGRYENPEGRPGFFTTAYFHHPAELEAELTAAGLEDVALYALEGPASKRLADPALELGDPVPRGPAERPETHRTRPGAAGRQRSHPGGGTTRETVDMHRTCGSDQKKSVQRANS